MLQYQTIFLGPYIAILTLCIFLILLQSSRSFFLEKSITLGNLIGIRSKSSIEQTCEINVRAPFQVGKTERVTNIQEGQHCCPLWVCGGGSMWKNKVTNRMIPLGYLLKKERKVPTTHCESQEKCHSKKLETKIPTIHRNTPLNVAKRFPTRSPSRFHSKQASPVLLEFSNEWNVFTGDPFLPWEKTTFVRI